MPLARLVWIVIWGGHGMRMGWCMDRAASGRPAMQCDTSGEGCYAACVPLARMWDAVGWWNALSDNSSNSKEALFAKQHHGAFGIVSALMPSPDIGRGLAGNSTIH